MGKAGMNGNSPVTRERAELNCHIRDENKQIKDGVMGDGRGLSKEEDFQVNEDMHGVNDGRPEQQLQGWEEFLSVRSLKVLLVENDDGTRNVLRALLQNCGYEVIEAENGLRAWKILEDLTTHVDLVLSEVVMPSFSGMDLLANIMDHKTRKNIPVILMSSQDSMSTVIKCLSMGAVDFLLKPIRKNELKNLWRHIWRKCHRQCSGSGSASDIRTQKSTKSSSFEESDKNTGSNCEDNIGLGNIGLTDKAEGDNGSGTETSQVDPSRDNTFGNDGVPAIKTSECEKQNEELGDVVVGNALAVGLPRTSVLQLDEPKEGLTNMTGTYKDKLSEMDSKNDDERTEKGQPDLNNEKPNWELRNQAVDLMGGIGNGTTDPQMQCIMFDDPNGVFKLPEIKAKAIHDSKEIPSLELSLMTQRDVRDARCSGHDQNVLRHSSNSAFSRYKFSTNSKQTPSGNVGSYSPLGNSSGGDNAKSFQNFQSKSYSTPLYQRSNGCSNNDGTGSTTNKFVANKETSEGNADPRSTIKCLHASSVFQPDHNRIMSYNQPIEQGQADAAVHNTTLSQEWGMKQHVQVQQQQHHMHNAHLDQHQQILNHDGLSLKNLAAPQCGSSNVQGAPMEGNIGSNSLHGCALERNNSINGQSGGSSAINSRGTYMESDKHMAGEEGTIRATEGGNKSGVDQNRLAQREAALHKFRQKRKDRCFEKKVRYQSRKKLAEERPRVRGQFIRQVVNETKGNDTDS